MPTAARAYLPGQFVADAPHGAQKLRPAGQELQLFAQVANVDVQTVFTAVVIRAPDGFAQGVIGHDVAPILGQLAQQSQFSGGQGQGGTVWKLDQRIVELDDAVPQCQLLRSAPRQLGAVDPLQNVLHPQEKLLHEEGFGQIIVCAKAQPEQPVGIGIPCGEEQRRDIRSGPQRPEQRKTVAVRQVDVQHHQVGRCGVEGSPRSGTGGCGADVVIPGPAQLFAEQAEQVRVVVHQKKFGIIDGSHSVRGPLCVFSSLYHKWPGRAALFRKFKAKLSSASGWIKAAGVS